MEIWKYTLHAFLLKKKHVVATIGNFDGLHRGHLSLIRHVILRSHILNALSMVITFDPHTFSVVNRHNKPKILMSLEQRLDVLLTLNVDIVWVINFHQKILNLNPMDFLFNLLNVMIPLEVYIGFGFNFGSNRYGSLSMFKYWGECIGCKVCDYSLLICNRSNISSTRIRMLLQLGRVEEANVLLGRKYSLLGVAKVYKIINFGLLNKYFIFEQGQILGNGIYITCIKNTNLILKNIICITIINKFLVWTTDKCYLVDSFVKTYLLVLNQCSFDYNVNLLVVRCLNYIDYFVCIGGL